jgi:multicomponent Na+:H+ antiporter subunit E
VFAPHGRGRPQGHPIHWRAGAAVVALADQGDREVGLDVSRIILDPRLPIVQRVRFKPGQSSDVGLVIHAQSITLTPGTITIEAAPHEFLVHGLTRAGALAVVDSEMDRRVTACEDRS